MGGKIIAAVLALLALSGIACAEVYTGVTAAFSEVKICAEANGVLENVCAETGFTVESGTILAEYRTEKIFAAQDGTVAAIHAAEGDRCAGTVLEILPTEKYRIYCTAASAYQSPESTLVHTGETVYIKCTTNGTHRGVGVIAGIDGIEYGVLTVGGEFHVGETVYLYRDADFSAKERVGIGTVVENDPEKYESEGKIVRMHVSAGEAVERGELLYETSPAGETVIRANVGGIVSGVNVAAGEAVQKGQLLMTVVPKENICAEIRVEESAVMRFRKGMPVQMSLAADREETFFAGTVAAIYAADDQGMYRIAIVPEETDGLKLGMTVQVRTD